MTTTTGAALERLVDQNLILCPSCVRQPLARKASTRLFCASCQSEYPVQDGVANLLLPQTEPSKPRLNSLVDAIAERYRIPADKYASLLEMIEDSLRPLPDGAAAGEINSFIDRFALTNRNVVFTLVRHYIDPQRPVPADIFITRSVRVRNDGDFPWASFVKPPLLLSYHWLHQAGSLAIFEGRRTSFPIEIAPGREITIPLEIQTPPKPGRYTLRMLPLQEGLRWHDKSAQDIPVTVGIPFPAIQPSDVKEAFHEEVDTRLSMEWLQRYLRTNPLPNNPLIVEIGGGSSPETLPLLKQLGIPKARVLNCDISMSLLRLCSLHLQYTDPESASRFACATADANELPIPDGSADMILMARALHHFPDPSHLLRSAATKLKSNGVLVILSEPVASIYDDHAIRLLGKGVNEQIFAVEDYLTIFARSGLHVKATRLDWGFSFKAILQTA